MDLRTFYEGTYSASGAEAERFAAWREMSALAKADHVIRLTRGLGTSPARVLDIGCGDGALIARLGMLRPLWEIAGVEIAAQAVELASARCPDADIRIYDGAVLPFDSGQFDLAILSHVLEHIPHPAPMLREAARVSRMLVVEVPLEANLSTRRESRRQIALDVGHLQRFSRASLLALIASTGLRVGGELSDPLGREAHEFFANSRAARRKAGLKWAVRAGVHTLSPRAARRIFTVHYACVCGPPGSPSASPYAESVN